MIRLGLKAIRGVGRTSTVLEAVEGHILGGDVLIGMDVITQGDFAVTNREGRTVFSFRVPSLIHLDFGRQSP